MLMIASTDALRRQNRVLVLSALRRAETASHTEIARQTRLSSATVTAVTADLEADAAIKRLDPVRTAGRGRPRVLFRLNAEAAYLAIIRITSDAIEYSFADYAGTLKDRLSEPRPQNGDTVAGFVERLNAGLCKLVDRAGVDHSQVKTISITSKGVVSPGLPVLLWSPVFGDQKIDFGAAMRSRWQAGIKLTNETRFAAQAYVQKNRIIHPIKMSRKTAVLSLGNSIGMGICSESASGEIQSSAPAFSHMVHRTDGPLCRCGERGCIEAYCGFYGILRAALQAPESSLAVSQVPLSMLDEIANDARSGNLQAQYAFRTAAEALGVGLSRVLSLFGAMPVVITGPGIRYLDLMKSTIEHHMRRNLYLRCQGESRILVEPEGAHFIYDGNLSSCLRDLDENVLAMGSGAKVRT
jgi:predicted NBD/HSP70 family sugar kinase